MRLSSKSWGESPAAHCLVIRGIVAAALHSMMTTLLVLFALSVAGLLTELIASAPLGYEDESGFHFGTEQASNEEFECGNPS